MRSMLSTVLSVLLASSALMAGAHLTTPDSEAKPFPDDWYYAGEKRPAQLKEMEGEKPPTLKLENWVGEEQDLEKLKGKVVVLDFWGTWCGPCMRAVPKNIEMVEKHKDDGLVFIGVHSTRGSDKMSGAVEKHGINYPVASDVKDESAKAWNVLFWPTYVVIDRSGIVRGVGLLPHKVKDAVEILLAEEAPETEGDAEAGSSSSKQKGESKDQDDDGDQPRNRPGGGGN